MRAWRTWIVAAIVAIAWAGCGSVKSFDDADGSDLQGDDTGGDDQDSVDTGYDAPDDLDDIEGPDSTDGPDAADTTEVTDTTDAADTPDVVPVCGNGTEEGAEGCDDGNLLDGDGCSSACAVEISSTCGDGVVDYARSEQCDDGGTADGDGCDSECRVEPGSGCGDGVLDLADAEECDDGDTVSGDGCSSSCQLELLGMTCGDSTTDPWEECDDGGTANGDACNPTCNLGNTTEVFVGAQGSQGLVDGIGGVARLGGYGTLAADNTYLYYADGGNHVVRRIEVATRSVQTIAGDAVGGTSGYLDDPTGTNARLAGVESITTDGHTLWIADTRRIRTVSLVAPFAVTTVAGSGAAAYTDDFGLAAEFDDLRGLTYYDGYVYLLDANAATLRRFDPVTTEVVTLAGTAYATATTDGFGSAARFVSPRYMTSDNSGTLYVADTNGYKIRAYNTVTTEVTTFAGNGTTGYADGVGTAAIIHRPRGMTSDGTSIYFVEFNQHTIRQGVLETLGVTTLAGQHCGGAATCTGGYAEGVGTAAQFSSPFSVVFHFPSNSLFVVDGGNFLIRRIY